MKHSFWLRLQHDWDLWRALRSHTAAETARLKPLGTERSMTQTK